MHDCHSRREINDVQAGREPKAAVGAGTKLIIMVPLAPRPRLESGRQQFGCSVRGHGHDISVLMIPAIDKAGTVVRSEISAASGLKL